MTGKKVLYVSSEVIPYLPNNDISTLSYSLPKMVNENGGQTRIFIPKYGLINERRHQLHEVIRLSGMNLIIDDLDMPLIIKVASIPKERMQVYFIDNDEYFKTFSIKPDEITILSYDALGLIYYVWNKNNGINSINDFFIKEKIKGKIGTFEFKDKKVSQQLKMYKTEKNKFKEY